MLWSTIQCHLQKNICSQQLNITAYIHTDRVHKYLSDRTKRAKFPRFFLLVPNSQERSSPKKLASIGGKILARLAPSHLAEERSAGLCGRETHIQRNSDIYMQFKEVHGKHCKTTRRRSILNFKSHNKDTSKKTKLGIKRALSAMFEHKIQYRCCQCTTARQ